MVAAAVAALDAGMTHYCPSAGIPSSARRSSRPSSARTRGGSIADASRCLVGTGAKPFVFFTILATCGPGDEVIYPDPGFPIYESAVRFAGAEPVPVPLLGADEF